MEINSLTLAVLIEQAHQFEISRNLEAQIEVFKPFWSDFFTDPDISGLPPETQAEILRLCGKFLFLYARTNPLPELQERGKDMLSAAAELFDALGDIDKASEARCQLAFSYYFDGRTDNSTAVLEYTLAEKSRLSVSQIVDIKINQLFVLIENRQFNECRPIFDFLSSVIGDCENRLKISFLNVSGLYEMHGTKDFVEAAQWFSKAVRFAFDNDDPRGAAQNLNNLANAEYAQGKLLSASKNIARAVSIAKSLDDRGWLASYYDTRANIELALGQHGRALKTIEKSLSYFEVSNDFCFHREALQTKIKILLAVGETAKAMLTNSKLLELIRSERGEIEAETCAAEFFSKISQTKILKSASDLIIKNPFLENIETINFPETCEMFFIPAAMAGVLGFKTDLFAAVEPFENDNPVIMMLKETGEFLLGNLMAEKIFIGGGSFEICFLLDHCGNQFPVSPADSVICGNVAAVAVASDMKDKCLLFNHFN